MGDGSQVDRQRVETRPDPARAAVWMERVSETAWLDLVGDVLTVVIDQSACFGGLG